MYERKSDYNIHKVHQNPIALRDKKCLQNVLEVIHLLYEYTQNHVFQNKVIIKDDS